MKSDLQILDDERINGVRDVIELEIPVDSGTPAPVVTFGPQDGSPLIAVVVPTVAEGIMSIELIGYIDEVQVARYELVLRDPNMV